MKFTPFSLCASLLLICTAYVFGAEQPRAPSEPGPSQVRPLPILPLVEQFDKNGDHRLDAAERQAAIAYLDKQPLPAPEPSSGRPGSMVPQGIALEPIKSGEKINPINVPSFPDRPLYDPGILRTLFIDFENSDWEKELTSFARTDINVPAKLLLDGKNYEGVGVHFHTPTTTPATATGFKRALDLRLDYTSDGQSIGGQRQLRLLDAATDPTLLRTVMHNHIAGQYTTAPLSQSCSRGNQWRKLGHLRQRPALRR